MENDEKCLSLNTGGSRRPTARGAARRLGSARLRLQVQCGSQLSHNLKLSPNERGERAFFSLVKGDGEDVPVLMWASCEERAKEQQKKGGNPQGERGPNRKGPRAINTRITISATNVPLGTPSSSSAPFSYPRGHDAHVHILSPPSFSSPFLSLFSHYAVCVSLSFSPLGLRVLCPCTSYSFSSTISAFVFLSPIHRRVPISLQPVKKFLAVYFFSGEVRGNTPRPAGDLVLIFD